MKAAASGGDMAVPFWISQRNEFVMELCYLIFQVTSPKKANNMVTICYYTILGSRNNAIPHNPQSS